MKKTILATICLLALTINTNAQITNPAPYCEAKIIAMTTPYDNHIKQVGVGALSNNSGAVYHAGSEYVYYNNITSVSLQKGINIPVTITVSKNDMELNACWVFIDYNLNNSFEEAELVGQASSTQISDAPFGDVNLSFNITIPTSALQGQTRIRIIYTSDMMLGNSTPVPCNSTTEMAQPAFYYGEIEDYKVTIESTAGTNEKTESEFGPLLVYPTVGTGVFNVACEVGLTLSIYNSMGEKMLEQIINSSKELLDISARSNGIYYIVATQGVAQKVQRVIKE